MKRLFAVLVICCCVVFTPSAVWADQPGKGVGHCHHTDKDHGKGHDRHNEGEGCEEPEHDGPDSGPVDRRDGPGDLPAPVEVSVLSQEATPAVAVETTENLLPFAG